MGNLLIALAVLAFIAGLGWFARWAGKNLDRE